MSTKHVAPNIRLYVDGEPAVLDLTRFTLMALTPATSETPSGALRFFVEKGLEVVGLFVVDDDSPDHGILKIQARRLPEDPAERSARVDALIRGQGKVAM